ncbi:MAG: hypothetical protein FJY75_04940 [Candidatus Eisenbacteria bacterium]|uniref:Lipoprotein n=1 Tax=Eiseniibacteriota bacterium TaxID=2212470 RepID=A0A937X7X1_UNCEI|nr:hypothetical protein [Candidatus Eisenbacteria bacterium]
MLPTAFRAALPVALWAILALPLLGAGCGGDGKGTAPVLLHPQDFLPTQVSGWEQAGAPQTGTTDAELQAVINGGYEIYTRHGMKEFAIADYAGSGAQAGAVLRVSIYEMTTAQGALDLYDDGDIRPSTIEAYPAVGETARLSPIIPTGKALDFVRARYYAKIEISNAVSPEEARNQAEFFAGNVDQEMTR